MARESAVSALRLVLWVWTLLAAAALLQPALGDLAGVLGVAGACRVVLPPLALTSRRPASPRAALSPVLLAAAAGAASLPAWLALLAPLGSALGLARGQPPLAPGLLRTLCDVGPGPLLEEGLYRARLLPALAAAMGAPLALLLASALFALPHGDPWLVLAAFGLGLALGGAYLAARSLPVCVAYHAGVNLAAALWLRGRFPPLAPLAATLASSALLGAAVLRARAVRRRP